MRYADQGATPRPRAALLVACLMFLLCLCLGATAGLVIRSVMAWAGPPPPALQRDRGVATPHPGVRRFAHLSHVGVDRPRT